MIFGKELNFKTQGFSDIINITDAVNDVIQESGIQGGLVTVSAIGSTASVTTIEYEPNLVADMQALLEKLAPKDMHTRHGSTWGDDNGFSHLRASLMGPSASVPIKNSKALLGTWQQIIVIDHDNQSRNRRIYVQLVGSDNR